MLSEIIPPVDKSLLENELTADKFVKKTNNGDNLIYIISAHNAPNVMKEIGRLRELTFRDAGGGTGQSLDIDIFDTAESPFWQLIVWNPEDKQITGGYRFIHGRSMMLDNNKNPLSPTSEIFTFSQEFVRGYLPVTIELGRSWVQPDYQPNNNFRKGLFSLDNLWDGLGALVIRNPDVEYFFGKITMYPTFNIKARDLILGFMHLYFPDKDGLVAPFAELKVKTITPLEEIWSMFTGTDYDTDYKLLVRLVRENGEQIPPLVNAYMSLSGTMKTFGTAINPHFGDVEETGILIKIADIFPEKKLRHVNSVT